MEQHQCHFCPETAPVDLENRSRLPKGWKWLTRRKEGLNAAPACPPCNGREFPMIMLRRVGGPQGRASRGGNYIRR